MLLFDPVAFWKVCHLLECHKLAQKMFHTLLCAEVKHSFTLWPTFVQIDYPKQAAKMMTQYNLPVDAPEFVRAKDAAKIASDVSCLISWNDF